MKFNNKKFANIYNIIAGASFALLGMYFFTFKETFYVGLFEIILGLVLLAKGVYGIIKSKK